MARYRKLMPHFFEDEKTAEMTPEQKIIVISAILGDPACKNTSGTGIFEISRATIAFLSRLDLSFICDQMGRTEKEFNLQLKRPVQTPLSDEEKLLIKGYFNSEKMDLLEYDPQNHIIFIKSFFKYNSGYKSSAEAIKDDFERTGKKSPLFWAKFASMYKTKLFKIYEILEDGETKSIFEEIIKLREDLIKK